MAKDATIRARVNGDLKEKFKKKLEEDGLTETYFLIACIMNYLEIKTVPENIKNGGINHEK